MNRPPLGPRPKWLWMTKEEIQEKAVTLMASMKVRYWEDATVNGQEDTNGDLIPCRVGDNWSLKIDIKTGHIQEWEKGKTAFVHYKVCDCGSYQILDKNKQVLAFIEGGYVPDIMCPVENGYGDYVIMEINEEGFIKDWRFTLKGFPIKREEY